MLCGDRDMLDAFMSFAVMFAMLFMMRMMMFPFLAVPLVFVVLLSTTMFSCQAPEILFDFLSLPRQTADGVFVAAAFGLLDFFVEFLQSLMMLIDFPCETWISFFCLTPAFPVPAPVPFFTLFSFFGRAAIIVRCG
jgi:hypothetical protein